MHKKNAAIFENVEKEDQDTDVIIVEQPTPSKNLKKSLSSLKQKSFKPASTILQQQTVPKVTANGDTVSQDSQDMSQVYGVTDGSMKQQKTNNFPLDLCVRKVIRISMERQTNSSLDLIQILKHYESQYATSSLLKFLQMASQTATHSSVLNFRNSSSNQFQEVAAEVLKFLYYFSYERTFPLKSDQPQSNAFWDEWFVFKQIFGSCF